MSRISELGATIDGELSGLKSRVTELEKAISLSTVEEHGRGIRRAFDYINEIGTRLTALEAKRAGTLDNCRWGVANCKWDGSGLVSLPTVIEHGLGKKPGIVLVNGAGGHYTALGFATDKSAWTDKSFDAFLLAALETPIGGTEQNIIWFAAV